MAATIPIAHTYSEEQALKLRNYKISQRIGEGGYSQVYLSEFSGGNKVIKLACKIINTQSAPKKFTEKFLPRELHILTKINHPHIIQIHSIFQRKFKYYIFMRQAEHGDLLDFILANGVVNQELARVWTRQISLAIQYLHVLEIAHRDIKCENILISIHYNVKLSDFGFARSVIDERNQRVLSDTYCGSLSYAAPQILAGVPYNPKTADIWSLGCLIYTMLNKSNPFDTKITKQLLEYQYAKKFEFRPKYARLYSDEAIILVKKCLEPYESFRYTIEQILDSPWISMDPKLRVLNAEEFNALKKAMEEAKRTVVTTPQNAELAQNTQKPKASILVLKEYDEAFDLQMITSTIQKFEGKLST